MKSRTSRNIRSILVDRSTALSSPAKSSAYVQAWRKDKTYETASGCSHATYLVMVFNIPGHTKLQTGLMNCSRLDWSTVVSFFSQAIEIRRTPTPKQSLHYVPTVADVSAIAATVLVVERQVMLPISIRSHYRWCNVSSRYSAHLTHSWVNKQRFALASHDPSLTSLSIGTVDRKSTANQAFKYRVLIARTSTTVSPFWCH